VSAEQIRHVKRGQHGLFAAAIGNRQSRRGASDAIGRRPRTLFFRGRLETGSIERKSGAGQAAVSKAVSFGTEGVSSLPAGSVASRLGSRRACDHETGT
jgi:hypothetical protein